MPEIEVELDYWAEDEKGEWDNLVSLRLFIRNTRLVEARKAKGLTQPEAAHLIGLSVSKLSQIENLRCVPSATQQYNIAAYFEKPADYLFPDILMRAIEDGVFQRRDAELAEPEIISLIEAQQLRLTYDGEGEILDEIDRHLLREHLDKMLSEITPREAEILRLRFGLRDGVSQTLEEVGWIFNLTRERIRQIEGKALRRLRHRARLRLLKDYLD